MTVTGAVRCPRPPSLPMDAETFTPRPVGQPSTDARARLRSTIWRTFLYPCLVLAPFALYGAAHLIAHSNRHGSPEMSAVTALRVLSHSQNDFMGSGSVAPDANGDGAPGTFWEMSGAVAPRGRTRPMNPPVLSGSYRSTPASGDATRANYHFRMFLSADDGTATSVSMPKGVSGARRDWCAYAWPAATSIGQRSFFLSSSGLILGTGSGIYRGARAPSAGAAFLSGGIDTMGSNLAIETHGQGGSLWQHITDRPRVDAATTARGDSNTVR